MLFVVEVTCHTNTMVVRRCHRCCYTYLYRLVFDVELPLLLAVVENACMIVHV